MAVRQPSIDLPARKARSDARAGRGWYAVLARTGLVAKGVSYGLVGVLAVALALGAGGQATSRQGALEKLATHSFGKVVLALLALGLAAYAIWRFVQAIAEREEDEAAKTWAKSAGAVIVGVGLWNFYRGVSRKFEDRWRTGRMSEQARKWGGRAGLGGHVARGVVFSLIGIFV